MNEIIREGAERVGGELAKRVSSPPGAAWCHASTTKSQVITPPRLPAKPIGRDSSAAIHIVDTHRSCFSCLRLSRVGRWPRPQRRPQVLQASTGRRHCTRLASHRLGRGERSSVEAPVGGFVLPNVRHERHAKVGEAGRSVLARRGVG